MATIHSGREHAISQIHFIEEIVDKVGSGDSCMAGLIAGCIKGNELQDIIDFAAAAAVSKLGQPGDWNLFSAEQIEKIITKVV
jgi:2-dehydro-3-deoxygluconokinase